ncbi:MAG: peptidylprolyl isomerase [Flavobacteriia bacterium]|nr:peptidylprolyl isomerase [Flavobacteriia bacterium]
MKFKLLISFLVLTITTCFSQQKEEHVVDKIVAQIGDNVILKSDIEAQKSQMIQAKMSIDSTSDCIILEELMYQNLLINQAIIDSLVIQDAQVDGEMENRLRMLEQQIGSRQKLEEFYGKSTSQIKEEFRESIKQRLMAQEMEFKITDGLTVTPKEVKEYFATVPSDSIPFINSKLSFQQIVFYPEITEEDKKIAYDKLNVIRNAILGGKSFETQARIHSMDPGSASQGGKYKATRGMMVPQFDAAVFSLNIGEISPIFETAYGYHIVTLLERKGDDYVCRHILITPEFNSESLDAAAIKMDSCYRELKENKITWENAVLKYSNDEMTKQNKGIITNPINGDQTWDMEDLNQVDHQIYVLTDVLEKGDITTPNLYMDIYDHKQGIRIVRLMERTAPHKANLNDDFALIRSAAENDKKQKIINKWIKNKLLNAYIKIDEAYKDCVFKNPWLVK